MIRITLALFVALLAATGPGRAQEQLVPPGAVWKYLDDGSNQGAAWFAIGFDDSSWASGPAQLGYGDGDESTLVGFGPSSSSKYVTTYFRHEFSVADPSPYIGLRLRLLRDDGAVVYLNGVEVARDNLPAGAVSSNTLASWAIASANEDRFFDYWLDSGQLVSGSNLLAVELHQVAVDSSDISLDLELLGETTLAIARGPYLQLGTGQELSLRWRTNASTDSLVRYGPAPTSLPFSALVPGARTDHEVALTGLAPGTTYYYSVGSSGTVLAGGDSEHRFVTAPPAGSVQPTRVWVLGDSGTANASARAVRDAFYAFNGSATTDLVLMLGDNAYDSGLDVEYQKAVFETYPDTLRQTVLWPARGNHERSAGTYYGIFTLPDAAQAGGTPSGTEAYYSFDHANIHFVCLDSEGSSRAVGGPMHTWLVNDLAATTQEWIIAYWHHPPYSKGTHNSNLEQTLIEMRTNFVPALEDGGVDLVLCGHSHNYERSFLIDGHYGTGGTLTPQMVLDGGDGRPDGTGAYNKADGAHQGAVYTVAGSSGKVGSGNPLNLNAMFIGVEVLGSVVLDVDGGELDLTFLDSTGQVVDWFTMLNASYSGVYCVPKVSSSGCIPAIASSGTPSASSPAPFLTAASGIDPNKNGLLFYGHAPLNAPFQGGQKCVAAPTRRTPLQTSVGAGSCGAGYSLDFNARIQSGADPNLTPGVTVYAQYWYRDPGSSSTTGLSDGLQFVIGP